jgi:hypothetical protein
VPKLWSTGASSTHGGHAAAHFGWAGGCESCHGAGAAAEAVVSNIHANDCDLCHNGGTYNATTNGAGPAANGIDGDAGLAEGAAIAGTPFDPATYVCTTCHAIGGGSVNAATLGGIHHDNKTNSPVLEAHCADCHNAIGGYDLDHNALVADTANCNTCHDATAAVASYPPLDDAVNATANKVHDYCTSCHVIAATPGADGQLDAVVAPGGSGNISAGDCNNCHDAYFPSHTNIDHTATVALDADTATKNECVDCHVGTEGTSTGVPLDATSPAGDKLHDACSTCHTVTGILTGPYGYASAMPDGGDGGGKNGGSVVAPNGCQACHGNYFDSHVHGTGTNHDLTYTPAIDLAQAAPGTPCANCHTPVGGLGTWTGIVNEHSGSCSTCHDYSGATTADATPPVSNNDNAIANNTASTCLTCHAPKETPAEHGYYNHLTNPAGGLSYAPITAVGDCNLCHRPAGTEEVIYDVHGGNCYYCHPGGSPPALQTTPNLNQFAGTTTACTDCHSDSNNTGFTYNFHGTAINHSETPARHNQITGSNHMAERNCSNCHIMATNQQKLDLHMDIGDAVVECTRCHFPNNYNSLSDSPAQAVIADGKEHNGNDTAKYCESCHDAKGTYLMHGLTDDNGVDGVADEHDKLTDSTGITPTFTNSKILLEQTEYSCYQCHDIDQGSENAAAWAKRIQVHTSTSGTGSGTCLTCHNSIAAFESVIDSGREGSHHVGGGSNTAQDCESCHNDTINGGGDTNSPTGRAMYQYDGERHHTTDHAQAGDCTWCHADPRPMTGDNVDTDPGWAGTAALISQSPDEKGWSVDYGMTTTPRPPQLACRLCHTNYDTTDLVGATRTTTGLIVYQNSYTPANVSGRPNGRTNWGVSGDTPVTQTPMASHTIPGASKIQITNYGACFSCHSVQIWHAKPVWVKSGTAGDDNTNDDTSGTMNDDTFDVLRQAPGRTYYTNSNTPNTSTDDSDADKLKFNIFATGSNTGGVEKLRVVGRYDFGSSGGRGSRGGNCDNQIYRDTSSEDRGQNFYCDYEANNDNPWVSNIPAAPNSARFIFPQVTAVTDGEGLMSSDPSVPYFTDVPTAEVDDITITSASWNSSTLTVTVTSSLGAGQTLALDYSDDSAACDTAAMTDDGGGSYSYSCNPANYTATVETVTVTNTSAANGGSRTASVVNSDTPGTIKLSSANYSVAEDGVSATITATRTNGSSGAVGVSYATSNGTANAGPDYTAVASTLAWADGEAGNKTFNIPVFDDGDCTGDETVNIAISSPTGGAILGSPSAAVLTLTAVENSGLLEFDSAAYSGNEDDGAVTFTVTRTGGTDCAVSVDYATADGTATLADSDYTAESDTLNWSAADGASKTFTVTPTTDATDEADEIVNVLLSNPSVASLGTQSSTIFTIINDDSPGELGISTANSSVAEDVGTVAITCTRTGGTKGAVSATVDYSTSTATYGAVNDYTLDTTTCSWADGDGADKTVTITINDDADTESDESVVLTLTAPTNGATLGGDVTVMTTIYDNENAPPVAVADAYTVDEDSVANPFYVMANDYDLDTDPITLDACNNDAANGTLVLNGNTCEYTPDPGYSGTDSFTYEISDDKAISDTGIVNVDVLGCTTGTVTLNGNWAGVSDTNGGSTISYSYGAPAGTDRMLIVVVTLEDSDWGGPETVSGVTYNSSAVNEITSQTSGDGDVWIGYQLLGTGGAISSTNVTATFTGSVDVSRIRVATYDNANQAAPANSNEQATTTNNQSISITNAEGGKVIYGVYFNNTNTITSPSGWTERDDITVTTGGWGATEYRMGVGDRNATTAGSVTVDPTSSGTNDTAILVGASIDPATNCNNNNAPTAVADSDTVDEDSTDNVIDVLANDSDTDGDSLAVTDCGSPSNGTSSVSATGDSCLYTPDADYIGADSFDYTVADGSLTDTATVSITVNNANQDAPTITVNQPDGISDTGATGGSFTINYDADDPDGDSISVDFYYDDNGSGEDGTAIGSCQNLTTKGTGLTCSWTSLPTGTWYVYGIVDDTTTTTTDYSSGTVVVSSVVSKPQDWITWDTASPVSITVAAGTNRLLVVSVNGEDTDNANCNVTNVRYENILLTQIGTLAFEDGGGTGYSNCTWVGYCDEACLTDGAADGSNNITVTTTNLNSGYGISAAVYENVNQITPVFATTSNNNRGAPITANVNRPAGGMTFYAANFNGNHTQAEVTQAGGFIETQHLDLGGTICTIVLHDSTATTGATPVNISVDAAGGGDSRNTIVSVSLNPN